MSPEVRSFIEENVPEGLADKVGGLVRPVVTARSSRCADDRIAIGASKFGGQPDLPARFEWPMIGTVPLWFIAQVRLADLKPLDAGLELPRTGLLSFFYHDDQGTAGTGARVYFFPDRRLRRTAIVPDARYGGQEFHDRLLYPRSLRFAQGHCLPAEPSQYRLTARQQERWDWTELLNFKEMFHARFSSGTHYLFGQPAHLKPPRGHLQLASFGEVSDRYHYFVPSAHLNRFDFTRVRVIYQCS